MTSPADTNVNNLLGGETPTGAPLKYQFNPEALGRVTWNSDDNVGPYQTTFVAGDPVVGSAATYDQVKSINKLQGSRHIDPFGTVVTPKKVWLLQWYWMLDGCPTPLTRERIAVYIENAKQLRAWPADIIEAMAANGGYVMPASEGAPVDYSGVNPDATLDSFVGGS
jgi:hypothetical protein